MLTGLTISNGIGWSPDGRTMYLNDSGTGCVDAFDFDGSSGAITRRRTLVRLDEPGVAPDGLTVDEEGGIWVALWDGGAVNRYAPDGTLLATVQLPVERPTSCAFGGPDLGHAVRHHAPETAWTTTPGRGSPTPDGCSRSTGSVSVASPARSTEVVCRWRCTRESFRSMSHAVSPTKEGRGLR